MLTAFKMERAGSEALLSIMQLERYELVDFMVGQHLLTIEDLAEYLSDTYDLCEECGERYYEVEVQTMCDECESRLFAKF